MVTVEQQEIMKADSSTRAAGFGYYRWIICALLFFATTINYVDRQILSLVKEILDKDLGWSATDFGRVNSAFQGAYALSLLFFGWFVDRFGTKIGYAVSIAAWSVMAIAHSFVGSVNGFLFARIGLGLSEGGNFPSAIKAVAHWFPKSERALATGLLNSGTNVGPLVAPAIVPAIALTWGWQWAFILAGAAGFLWLLLWIALYDLPARVQRLSAAEYAHIHSDVDAPEARDATNAARTPEGTTGPSVPGRDPSINRRPSWTGLLRCRQTWAFVIAKFMTDPVWWFFLIWLPDFFKRTYGLDIKRSWDKLVAIYAIITVLSLIGAWVTGHLAKRGWSITSARKTGMLLFAVCVLPVWMATQLEVWPAVLLIALAGAAHQAWSANLYTTVSDMFPKSAVASVIGIGGLAGAIGGMIFPLYCGHVLDAFKAHGNESGAYTELLHICAFAYLIAFGTHHWLAPRFEQTARVQT